MEDQKLSDRLIAEAEELEEIEKLRKLDEAEHVMEEAEKYLQSAKNERSERNEFPTEDNVISEEFESEKEEASSPNRENERKVMVVDVIVIESTSTEEEEESDEESEEEKRSDNSCLAYITIMGALFIGFFSFFVFYPPKYNADNLWIAFADNCCSIFHNVTRCVLDITCKSKLDLWIYSMNNTVDYLRNCCYIYGPYDSWFFFAQRYCDPFCLRPKLF